MERKLTRQDAIDLWEGTKILGCGGGGEPSAGLRYVEETYEQGRSFILAQADDLRDDTLIITIGFVGGGVSAEEAREASSLEPQGNTVLRAIRALEVHLGRSIGAYMPCEPGAGNSFVPLYAAALNGVVTVDLDTAGRAKPEIVNSTTSIFSVPLTPLAIASDHGDVLILQEAANVHRVEQICRYVARASGGMCVVARCPITIAEARGKLLSGTLGHALAAGRAIRESNEPVSALVKVLGGQLLFRGIISSCSRQEEGGFMWGSIVLAGAGEFAGESYRLYFKNENLVGWRNNVPDVTTPDTIALVDTKTGEGVYNWTDSSLREGRDCTVVGVQAASLWLNPRGLELFGPRHFGFDFDYVPRCG